MIIIKKELITDIANVACFNMREQAAKLSYIDALYKTIPKEIEIVGIADISLFRKIDERIRYKRNYLIPKRIIEAPSKTKADEFILNYALEKNAFILSNDQYREYNFVPEDWLEEHRVSFMFIKGQIIFQYPLDDIIGKVLGDQEISSLRSNQEINDEIEEGYLL
ncbi:hypothetical protein LCGC14_1309440 [marine sediment metagenome]|uniref:RNase NYN domain-containing protein n=1 Tax=marine sediment metagenome TaxID=412755 RepID=A0A0F9L7R0_9ZZZZ